MSKYNNPLEYEATNLEKANKIEEARKQRRKENIANFFENIFKSPKMLLSVIPVFLAIISVVSWFILLSNASYSVIKVFFWVDLAIIAICVILFFHEYRLTNFSFILLIIVSISSVVSTFAFGADYRFKIDKVITSIDGFTYAIEDDQYYIYKYQGGLQELDFSNIPYRIAGVKKGAFEGNQGLESITFSGNLQIDKNAFKNCVNLTNVNFNAGTYTFIKGENFSGCYNLKEIYINSGAKLNGGKVKGFSGLGDIEIYIEKDGYLNFDPTSALSVTLIISPGCIGISDGANNALFSHVKTLVFKEGFDFQNWQWQNKLVTAYAEEIYLPSSVTQVPNDIFGSAEFGSGMKAYTCLVYYQGDKEGWKNVTIPATGWLGTNSIISSSSNIIVYDSNCKYWDASANE